MIFCCVEIRSWREKGHHLGEGEGAAAAGERMRGNVNQDFHLTKHDKEPWKGEEGGGHNRERTELVPEVEEEAAL